MNNNNIFGDANSGIRIVSHIATTHYNWRIGAQAIISGLDFTPSTTPGGTTFSTPAMVILPDTGNVGIGTTSPGTKLDILPSSENAFRIQSGGGTSGNFYIGQWGGSGSNWNIGAQSGTTMNLYINRNAASGDVIIGATNAGTGPVPLIVKDTGNVGIGTSNPGTHRLHVVGTAGLTTGTAWTNTSDRRWKDVQGEIKGKSLNKILALRPISYKWNDLHNRQFGENPGLKYGFIAQEVKEILPELISQDADGYYWYNPSGMEAILTAAIQEQQKEIEELKRAIQELKNMK